MVEPACPSRRGFLIGSTLAGIALMAACAERKPYSAVGKPFPDFRLQDIDGVEHALSRYVDFPMVVNFWATWCPPCRTEMPDLERLHRRDSARGLRVLGFSIDADPNPVREFRLRLGLTFPLLIDSGQEIARLIGIDNYPTTLLVAPGGMVTEVIVGIRPWPEYPGIHALNRMTK